MGGSLGVVVYKDQSGNYILFGASNPRWGSARIGMVRQRKAITSNNDNETWRKARSTSTSVNSGFAEGQTETENDVVVAAFKYTG